MKTFKIIAFGKEQTHAVVRVVEQHYYIYPIILLNSILWSSVTSHFHLFYSILYILLFYTHIIPPLNSLLNSIYSCLELKLRVLFTYLTKLHLFLLVISCSSQSHSCSIFWMFLISISYHQRRVPRSNFFGNSFSFQTQQKQQKLVRKPKDTRQNHLDCVKHTSTFLQNSHIWR
jgi:hypothetical protein